MFGIALVGGRMEDRCLYIHAAIGLAPSGVPSSTSQASENAEEVRPCGSWHKLADGSQSMEAMADSPHRIVGSLLASVITQRSFT
jgi:hypothetical protein